MKILTLLAFFKKQKARVLMSIIVIIFLLLIEGGLSLKYIKDLTHRSEEVYQVTTKGSIELNLLEEQLRELETVYALGLNEQSDTVKIKYLSSEMISNLAILIETYPGEPFIANLSNQVVKLLRIFDELDEEGFQWEVMNELRERNQKIKSDLIIFKASRRLKGSSVVRDTELFSERSRNIFVFSLILSLVGITALIMIIVRSKTTDQASKESVVLSFGPQSVGGFKIEEKESLLRLKKMSSRELEVLKLMALGYSNKQIADELFVAEQTVKNYVSNIYSKLGVNDRVTVSILALKAGLINETETSTSSDKDF